MQDLNAIKTRFLALNRDRLTRLRDTLRPRQQILIDLLPLLFHVNHRNLPGYVSESTPVGVFDYAPGNRLIESAARLMPGFDYRRRALARYDIQALFLMGSGGTIAYSTESDFDIWLCHDPALPPGRVSELQAKARAIELWAATYELEVHFFLMNADQFRNGEVIELSSESSGSAQHHLLLDEFYRTSLLLAGRYPVWWLVPPDEEHRYDEHVAGLMKQQRLRTSEVIDFGGLPRAPAEEFFGAALWQLYKSIDSPYKAALKLMLMEVYASEYPDVDLLSMQFKRRVHEGNIDQARLDPYLMLCDKLEEYLERQDDRNRLELMRRCFYFKVNERMGDPDTTRNMSWRREVMSALARKWGWDRDYMHTLDTRRRWKIHRVLEERKSLVSALTQSYHSLSRFARTQDMLARIDQNDLNILGRKLYAAFERKAGKVDIINRGISDDIREDQISLHQINGSGDNGWVLYRGMVQAGEATDHKPLKRSRSILELLVWAWLNQLIDERTSITLFCRDSTISLSEIRALIRSLEQIFPGSVLPAARFKDLSEAPQLTLMHLFVNVGIRPDSVRTREGKHLSSDKTDALSYGGVCENQILSIDQLSRTSWQEVMTFPYAEVEGLFECLAAYLRWSPPSTGVRPPPVRAWCFSSSHSMTITRRVEELFGDIVDCFYREDTDPNTRYILLVGQKYHALRLRKDDLVHEPVGSHNDLIRYLSRPLNEFSPVHIDRHALGNDILPLIYQNNRPGMTQLFYFEEAQAIYLYFIDANGALFYRRSAKMDIQLLVGQYLRFLRSVTARRSMHAAAGECRVDAEPAIEVYRVRKQYHGKGLLVRHNEPPSGGEQQYVQVQVITGISKENVPEYTIYIGDREFSSLEFGAGLYREAAAHILELRRNGPRYPIYITDIDLEHRIVGLRSPDRLQLVHYLDHKKQIEDRLNLALASMLDGHAAGQGS